MRLEHISFRPLEIGDILHDVGGLSVWLPYGWSARLVIGQITGPQFGKLEDRQRLTRWFNFADTPPYNYRKELARIDVFDRDFIGKYVSRGVFHTPPIAAELGEELFQRILREIE